MIKQFFQDDNGQASMSRLMMFVNVIVAAYVTITVAVSGAIGYDAITLIFGLWVFAYSGKNAAKYIEKMNTK